MHVLRAPHVLSLELKDMAKIPAVAAVIEGAQKILARFWGRKRWDFRGRTNGFKFF